MAASYMAAGFVHGVLNSDNINISAESFDYGPWRFTPRWEAGFTAAYFDYQGLYSFGRQAEAIHWDVVQLAQSLATLSSSSRNTATMYADHDALRAALDLFGPAYQAAVAERILWRLGVVSQGFEADVALVQAIERGLSNSGVEINRFFFDWRGGQLRTPTELYADTAFEGFKRLIIHHSTESRNDGDTLTQPYWDDAAPCSMHIDEVEAIWEPIATRDDWSPLHAKVEAIRRMGAAHKSELPPIISERAAE